MTPQQSIELTIRTATLIKSLGELVGTEHANIAKLQFALCIDGFAALGKFIEKCNAEGKRASNDHHE